MFELIDKLRQVKSVAGADHLGRKITGNRIMNPPPVFIREHNLARCHREGHPYPSKL